MKKLLVILMVVAMASFLFVGCMPGVTPPDDDDDDDDEPNEAPYITSAAITSGKVGVAYTYDVVATDPDGDTLAYSLTKKPLGMAIVATTGVISWKPTAVGEVEVAVKVSDPDGLSDTQSFKITVAAADVVLEPTETPVIMTIPDIVGGFVNAARAADGIVVNGTAPTDSEVEVYINGICAGTGDTQWNGVFQVVIANADLIKAGLKVDGAKILYATATEPGKKESAKSIERKFILDTDLPGIKELKATADFALVPGAATVAPLFNAAGSALSVALAVTPASVETGTWGINIYGATNTAGNLVITRPDTTPVTYNNVVDGQVFLAGVPIPGVQFTLTTVGTQGTLAAGQQSVITCIAETPAIISRATLEFDEDVSITSAAAGTYAFTADGVAVVPVAILYDANIVYWSTFVGVLVTGDFLECLVSGVDDAAGNTITALSSATCTVGTASETLLEP